MASNQARVNQEVWLLESKDLALILLKLSEVKILLHLNILIKYIAEHMMGVPQQAVALVGQIKLHRRNLSYESASCVPRVARYVLEFQTCLALRG